MPSRTNGNGSQQESKSSSEWQSGAAGKQQTERSQNQKDLNLKVCQSPRLFQCVLNYVAGSSSISTWQCSLGLRLCNGVFLARFKGHILCGSFTTRMLHSVDVVCALRGSAAAFGRHRLFRRVAAWELNMTRDGTISSVNETRLP